MTGPQPNSSERLRQALSAARHTRELRIGQNVLPVVPEVFHRQFGDAPAAIVADANTFAAAGHAIQQALAKSNVRSLEPFIFDDSLLFAEYSFVEQLQNWAARHRANLIAVGSGTINDLTKMVSGNIGRPYMVVATAASMDGYSAYGASITYHGCKQTFDCPAPQAVVADLDVIAAAPPMMNAAGYADLMAKITAGADWILADALGIEPIDPTAWDMVQTPLREALADPAGVRAGNIDAIQRLTEGLMMSGFAMQYAQSSRPASGAEHQFSHLWDMQRKDHHGNVPSHGFQVGIGTVAVARLYEYLLSVTMDRLDVERATAGWLEPAQVDVMIYRLLGNGELAARAKIEMAAKTIDRSALRSQLSLLRQVWPSLVKRLREQLPPVDELIRNLSAAGAPTEPEQIGISRQRLRESYQQAYLIRRRFTVLDLLARTGIEYFSGSC